MWLHDDFYRSLRCKNWSCCLRLPFKGDRDNAICTSIKPIKTKIEPHNGTRFRVLSIVFEFWEKQLVSYKYIKHYVWYKYIAGCAGKFLWITSCTSNFNSKRFYFIQGVSNTNRNVINVNLESFIIVTTVIPLCSCQFLLTCTSLWITPSE